MKRCLLVLLLLSALVTASLGLTGKPPLFKNLKVLPRNITKDQMDSVMHHFCLSLSVGCDFCHVENKAAEVWDFASDEKKHKLTAREMMRMTDKINDKYFNVTGGKRTLNSILMVTCFTCHNGKTEPAIKPMVPEATDNLQAADSSKSK